MSLDVPGDTLKKGDKRAALMWVRSREWVADGDVELLYRWVEGGSSCQWVYSPVPSLSHGYPSCRIMRAAHLPPQEAGGVGHVRSVSVPQAPALSFSEQTLALRHVDTGDGWPLQAGRGRGTVCPLPPPRPQNLWSGFWVTSDLIPTSSETR